MEGEDKILIRLWEFFRGLDTLGRSTILYKEDYFVTYLHSFAYNPLLIMVYSTRKEFATSGANSSLLE